eukprot:2248592-Rhodomonas_salina.5
MTIARAEDGEVNLSFHWMGLRSGVGRLVRSRRKSWLEAAKVAGRAWRRRSSRVETMPSSIRGAGKAGTRRAGGVGREVLFQSSHTLFCVSEEEGKSLNPTAGRFPA